MAHLIDLSNARENIAYTKGQVPWHGLGVPMKDTDSLDKWIEQAGFNWEVKSAPVSFMAGKQSIVVPRRRALYRSDTLAPLSVVSDNYNETQPKQVAEFFRDLVKTAGFKIETMGMLKGGAMYWAMAKVGDALDLGHNDTVLPYLLLATSCDGTLSNCATFTTVRVVCWNTLSAAVGSDGKSAQVRIPHSTKFNETRMKQELGLIPGGWERFSKTAKDLTKRKLSKEEATKYFLDVLYPNQEDVNVDIARPALAQIQQIYTHGIGQKTKTATGTVWGVLNAVTRYVDFEKKSANNDNRMQSAWFGAGQRMKQRAFDQAIALAA